MDEYNAYREQLAELRKHVGDKEVVSVPEVIKITQMDRRTVEKYLGVRPPGISTVELAHRMVKAFSKLPRNRVI